MCDNNWGSHRHGFSQPVMHCWGKAMLSSTLNNINERLLNVLFLNVDVLGCHFYNHYLSGWLGLLEADIKTI